MPRPRKSPDEIRAARQRAANARWAKLTPRQRRNATAPARAASPANKPASSAPRG